MGVLLTFSLLLLLSEQTSCQPCNAGLSDLADAGGTVPGEDSRQFLLPSLSFACQGRILQWSLHVQTTNLLLGRPGIVVQVWSTDQNGCLYLKQQSGYSVTAVRGITFQLTLSDPQYQMDVGPGDFVGYFVYEEGLSPLHHPLPHRSNATVLEIDGRRTQYCLRGRQTLGGLEVLSQQYSPLISLDFTALLVPAPTSTEVVMATTVTPPSLQGLSSPESHTPSLTIDDQNLKTSSKVTNDPAGNPTRFDGSTVGIGLGVSFCVVLLVGVAMAIFFLLCCAISEVMRKKRSSPSTSSYCQWRRASMSSSSPAEMEERGAVNRDEWGEGKGFSSSSGLKRTETKETHLDDYCTIDEQEVQRFPHLIGLPDEHIYSEVSCALTTANNPLYYVPSQSQRKTGEYALLESSSSCRDLQGGGGVSGDYSRLSFTEGPSLESREQLVQLYGHLATEPFWKPPTHTDALYNVLSSKRFLEIPRCDVLCLDDSLLVGAGVRYRSGHWKVAGSQMEVEVKTMDGATPLSNDPAHTLQLLREAAILGQFSHSNIIRLYGVVSIGKPVMVVTELMKGGSLSGYLKTLKKGADHSKLLTKYSLQIADAGSYLEKKGFVHRDLAAHSVLLSEDHLVAKISNFRLTRNLNDGDGDSCSGPRQEMVPLRWTSPEALKDRCCTPAGDVWSYGMLLWEMWMQGTAPFPGHSLEEVLDVLVVNKSKYRHHGQPASCPQSLYNIMVQCWEFDPAKRPSFAELTEQLASLCPSVKP